MRSLFIRSMLIAVMAIAPAVAFADTSHGTADEAKAMVDRAVAHIKEVGTAKAFADIGDPANQDFHDRDLYVMVYDQTGKCVAHGANPALIGRSLIDLKDTDGKYLIKDLVGVEDAGWIEYKWPHPITKKVEPKVTYVVRVGDYRIGVGAYK